MTSPLLEDRSDEPSGAGWVAELSGDRAQREPALVRLHDFLLRGARAESRRRAVHLGIVGPELDDIAHQAADDALVAIVGKLASFRGESRFTTWAYKFVILEVASKINRHHWRRAAVVLDADGWERLPSRLGMAPEDAAEYAELMASLRRAVEDGLTERQRDTFVAIVVDGIPLDQLVADTGSSRGAIYKMMFDARRKIRAALAADGHVRDDTSTHRRASRPHTRGGQMTGWIALDRLLDTDPGDAGCDIAQDLLDAYAERLRADRDAARLRFPQVAAHLKACGPCADDFEGLLYALDASD